jgi:hypothetical protein
MRSAVPSAKIMSSFTFCWRVTAALLRPYVIVRGGLWFAKTLSDNDFNRIQGCRPQAKCDSTLGWPFGYS